MSSETMVREATSANNQNLKSLGDMVAESYRIAERSNVTQNELRQYSTNLTHAFQNYVNANVNLIQRLSQI